ncbi:GNAT family N-acetyltransferase [Boseongicola aestuarii]|uniref:GNAT family N-acetyltransferase n=1 Tax=Boseongicola aestuarii TaxID=1470561 RepID=UPI001FE970B1|nr:GNAT family N-acetyltransferase [Boseongicola aestuarii]
MNQLVAHESVSPLRTQARYPTRYKVRFVDSEDDFEAALALRGRVFRGGGSDRDAFDVLCRHMVIVRLADGEVVATFRLLSLGSGAEIARSYAAQSYDLAALQAYPFAMMELGRFCISPDVSDPDILRAAWGGMARLVDEDDVQMLFGCASFSGTEPAQYFDALALLRAQFLAPVDWAPGRRAPDIVRFDRDVPDGLDRVRALKVMPPLLRSYLTMGGWVSDHAVVDPDLGTMHVFTGLEIAAIPEARARAIRAAAGAV